MAALAPIAGSPTAGTGGATVGATGTAAGHGVVSGIGHATFKGVGAAVGGAVVLGHGNALKPAHGTIVGAGVALGIGRSTARSAATVTGSGVCLGIGHVIFKGVGLIAGSASVLGRGSAIKKTVGTSTGHGTVAGIGHATVAAHGTSAGSSAASGHGAARVAAAGTVSGAGVDLGVGHATFKGAGTISGSGTAAAAGSVVFRAAGTIVGAGSLLAHGIALKKAVGTVSGHGSVTAVGTFTLAGQGVAHASGSGVLLGRGVTIHYGTGTISGGSSVSAAAKSIGQAAGHIVGSAVVNAPGIPFSIGTGTVSSAAAVSAEGIELLPPGGKSVGETVDDQNPLASALHAGVQLLSQQQEVCFTKYVRLVLPLDGYVFWVRASLLSDSALSNTSAYNTFSLNQPQTRVSTAAELCVQGSLHYSTVNSQDEEDSTSVNRVVFTALAPVQELNDIDPQVLYIATIDGIRFAFSQRESFYRQAGLWHYRGDAVYPTMDTQIIDAVEGFDTRSVIVSNSLPVWLSLNSIIPVFPSFLVPDNLRPPYGAIHINPASTLAIQAVPAIDRCSNHFQLAQDTVKITLFGTRNFNALDYQDYVLDYMTDNDDIMGLMNMPLMRDEKAVQAELSTLAQRKSIEFQVSYYQSTMRNIARQFIKSCIPTYTVL